MGKKVTLNGSKIDPDDKENEKIKVNELHQATKKDESGKDIEFVKWFPSSFLSKPSRSPVCIIILMFIF